MATAEFRNAISEPWTSLQPLRVGHVPAGLGAPNRYVIIDAGEKLLRVDIYGCAQAFEEVLVWGDFVVIGFGHHIFLIPLHDGEVITIDVGLYFGHLHVKEDVLLVASDSRLLRVSPEGELIWKSPKLAMDGVVVDRVQDGIVYGQGDWDPPAGWKPFAVRLDSGKAGS